MTKITQELLAKPISELTDEELELVTQERKKKAAKAEKRKREAYEHEREVLIKSLCAKAADMNQKIAELKATSFGQLDKFYERMKEYGEISTDNRGNFSIKTKDGRLKIEYTNHVIREFDERAETAVEHMELFLKEEFVKKHSQEAYDMIKSLLHRKDSDGSFDINLINRLEQMRDRFNHEHWIKALDLFKESYSESGSSQYIRFYERDPSTQKFKLINLNFASV